MQQCFFCSNSPITLSPNLSRLPATVDCQTPLAKKKESQFLTLPFPFFAPAPSPSAPRKIQIQIFFFSHTHHTFRRVVVSVLLFSSTRTKSDAVTFQLPLDCWLNIYQTGLFFNPLPLCRQPLLAIETTTTTTTPINTSTSGSVC